MTKESKGERNLRRFAYALALLVPLVCILVAEATGWNVMSVYLTASGIEYACLVVLALLFAVFGLLWLWSYIRIRFF